jgi:hypothetical protein
MKKILLISALFLTTLYACVAQQQINQTIVKDNPKVTLTGTNGTPAQVTLNGVSLTGTSGKVTLGGGYFDLGTNGLHGTGSIGLTNERFLKIWLVDGEFTHVPTVGGKSIFDSPPITGTLVVPRSPVDANDATTKSYVDSKLTMGITWVDPVEDIVSTLASGKAISLRYIKSTDNHIYVSNGDNSYTDLGATITGTTSFVKADAALPANNVGSYNFNGTAWVSISSSVTGVHNDLTGLQGGTSGEYYHLTAAEHTSMGNLTTPGTAGNILQSSGSAWQSVAVPTWNQNTTGTAAKATILENTRTIFSFNFNGSQNLTGVISSVYGGTGNGFTKFTGPATTEKTFTLPNASATILTDNAAVTVTQGGTGRATGATAYGIITAGNTATGAQQTVSAGTSGQILRSGGASALPGWSTATYPATAGSSRKILVSDGSNIVSSTETYAVPGTSGNFMISDGTNWTSGALPTVAVNQGGTGRATSTTAYALLAAGTTPTGAQQSLPTGSSGQILRSGGSGALPGWSTATYPATAGSARKILVSDGTNIVSSTETYAVPGASGNLMKSDGTNWTSSVPADTLSLVDLAVMKHPTITQKTDNFTLGVLDDGTIITMNKSSGTTITVPLNSSQAIPVGATIRVFNIGAGAITISITGGVTSYASALHIAQNKHAEFTKLATDTWVIVGELN